MILWLIALVIFALTAVAGYYQGVVRAAMSLVGLVVASFLAPPLSSLARPVVKWCGVEQPMLQQMLAPALVFIVVLIAFKIAAQTLNHKINHYFEYKATERQRMHWDEFQPRVGLCVGLFNGAIYFIALMIPLYIFGYVAVQMSSEKEDPAGLRFLSAARKELHTLKFDKVVAAHDPAPADFYEVADVLALIFRNPNAENRLSHYPTVLTLAERPEFQDLANDTEFHALWQSGATIGQLLSHAKIQAMLHNKPLLDDIQRLLLPDLKDLHEFFRTGKSTKYRDEQLLGRWAINLSATVEMEKKEKRSLAPIELRRLRERTAPLIGATLVVTTENKILLKRGPHAPNEQSLPPMIAEGTWSLENGTYKITLEGKPVEALLDGNKLILPKDNLSLVFEKDL